MSESKQIKKLRLVTTPIGNLDDVSTRVISALENADIIIAEDTRVSQKLYQLIGIETTKKSFVSFHEHNQSEVEKLVELVVGHDAPIIVSDAGSPILSDPGYPFVKEWIERGFEVEAIAGPSAVTMALELSGLPPVPFSFIGFLPRKDEALKKVFSKLSSQQSYVFFESPHRIIQTMDLVCREYPEASIFLGRELTKKFEEHYRFFGREWAEIKKDIKAKGEFAGVVYINESEEVVVSSHEYGELAKNYLKKQSPKNLAKLLAKLTGSKTPDIYEMLKKD